MLPNLVSGGGRRDRLTLARQALDGPTEAQLGQAGGGQPVVTDSMRDVGMAPDEVATTGATTILDGGAGTGGGGTTYSDNAVMPDENGEGGVTGELEGGQTSGDFDTAAEEFNWSLLDDALQGVDTTEEEAQMQGQQDRLMGQQLMDQRASAGASGFGESGAMMAMENDTRSDAARQLGLDVSGLRRGEAQQAIENAMAAQGIDIEKMKAADQARLNELIASFMMNDGEPPPAGTPVTSTVTNQDGEKVEVVERPGESFQKDVDVAKYGSEVKNSGTVGDDWEQIDTDDMGNTIWQAPDGTVYRVPKGW